MPSWNAWWMKDRVVQLKEGVSVNALRWDILITVIKICRSKLQNQSKLFLDTVDEQQEKVASFLQKDVHNNCKKFCKICLLVNFVVALQTEL